MGECGGQKAVAQKRSFEGLTQKITTVAFDKNKEKRKEVKLMEMRAKLNADERWEKGLFGNY